MKKNAIKKVVVLSLFGLMTLAFYGGIKALDVTADSPTTVYVSTSGSNSNSGTNTAPYATFQYALSKVENGGTIVLQDSVAVGTWTAHDKTVMVKGGSLNATSVPSLQIKDNVTFVDTSILVNADSYICANGYTVVIDEGVSLSNAVDVFAGGDEGTTVAGTSLTLLSGTYKGVYGGSRMGTVDGDTHLTVGGSVNAGLDVSDHEGTAIFFGGGARDTITGDTYLTFGGSAKSTHLFGGSYGSRATIGGEANLIVTGGVSMSMFGGSKGIDTGCDVNVKVTGGTFEQIFGGSESAVLTGDVDLRVMGGTITRRIYGGCYNDYGFGWDTSHSVNGSVRLIIGGEANITFGYSGDDKSIYGHSRYKTNSATENSQIVFADETAYNKYKDKLGAQDSTMQWILGSLSEADALHYYSYSVDGNVITQNCTYHTLAATATVNLDNNALKYTGAEVTPVSITYSNAWEYEELALSYENNIEEGIATYIIGAGNTILTNTFEIRKSPIVLGGSVRLSTPAGVRFQSKVEESLVSEGATFGTLVIPKAVLGEAELTHETASVRNIPQTKWATDSVKENNPQDYEEGYAYFNAVLTDIPAEHYDKVIVARSYAYLNGVYYYSEPMERSIAQVAAYAIQDGYTESVLFTYVDTALANETLSLESRVEVKEGLSYQLTLTGNKGYVAIWQSSDTRIAKVDNTGRVTALRPGQVTITAKIGNKTVECILVVKQNWSGTY